MMPSEGQCRFTDQQHAYLSDSVMWLKLFYDIAVKLPNGRGVLIRTEDVFNCLRFDYIPVGAPATVFPYSIYAFFY